MYRLDSTVAITLPVDFDVQPDSSFIQRIAYDAANSRCYVTMHDTTYEYDGVPFEDFAELWSADSVGNQYQMFRLEHGPAILSGISGKNIEFELRGMKVDPDDDIPLRDEESVTESDDSLAEWELDAESILNIRALALEAASRVEDNTNSVLISARQFEEYLRAG